VSVYRLGHINPTATAVYGVVGSELISGLKLGVLRGGQAYRL